MLDVIVWKPRKSFIIMQSTNLSGSVAEKKIKFKLFRFLTIRLTGETWVDCFLGKILVDTFIMDTTLSILLAVWCSSSL